MPKLRAHNISISFDGYAAGPSQDLEHPLGVNGERLHEWALATRTLRRMLGIDAGDMGSGDMDPADRDLDDEFAARGNDGIGATIIGRNMFGPIRGPWGSHEWTGWWGDEPPYHHPVFVLTHHPRPPIVMRGGTTFHFVADGIESALQQAFEASGGQDVRLGGGADTIQQYLRAGLLDEIHVVVVPVLLGSGERLFDRLDGGPVGYECVEFVSSPAVAHTRFVRVGRA